MDFTKAQLDAIRHFTGPAMIAAGPGSGKTTVIVHHILYLIQQEHVDPKQILVLTFTRAAAEEMSTRFIKFFSYQKEGPVFGTFHSVFYRMLKESGPGFIRIASDKEKTRIIHSLLRQFGIETDDPDRLIRNILSEISRSKNSSNPEASVFSGFLREDALHSIRDAYQQAMKNSGLLDYDDILLQIRQILLKQPEVKQKWNKQFSFILVDEFQDINEVQYDILKLLVYPQNNLFVVGDINQCIYGFRGSRPELMRQFHLDYPNARSIFLDLNYRCSNVINDAAEKLLSAASGNSGKHIKAVISYPGTDFRINCYRDNKEQYTAIADQIKEFHNSGISYDAMTILLRSNRDIPYLCSLLSKKGIPYISSGQEGSFLEHFITKDILAYLKAANGTAARADLLRIINRSDIWIPRYIVPEHPNDQWIDQILSFFDNDPESKQELIHFRSELLFLSKLSSFASVEYVLHSLSYGEFLTEAAMQDHCDTDIYDPVISMVKTLAKSCPSQDSFIKILEGKEEQELVASLFLSSREAIKVQTMHASKGLEYDVVFIPDLNKGIMPSSRSDITNPEEERRLLYVAMTRARIILQLSYVEYINGKKVSPSVFIKDLKDSSVCMKQKTKSNLVFFSYTV